MAGNFIHRQSTVFKQMDLLKKTYRHCIIRKLINQNKRAVGRIIMIGIGRKGFGRFKVYLRYFIHL